MPYKMIKDSVTPEALLALEQQGEQEYYDHIRKNYEESQLKSKYAQVDLGGNADVEELFKNPSQALLAYFEKDAVMPEQKQQELIGVNNDTGVGLPGIKPTIPAILTMTNAAKVEEIKFPFVHKGRKIDRDALLVAAGMEGTKVVLNKITTKEGKELFQIPVHLVSGDNKKKDRKKELGFIQALVNALGEEVVWGGDFQDSPFETRKNAAGEEEFVTDAEGRLVFSEDLKNTLDKDLAGVTITQAAYQKNVYMKKRGLFSDGCDISLMPAEEKLLESRVDKLYLYRDPKGVFYRVPGNAQNQYLDNPSPALLKAMLNVKDKSVAFTNEAACKAILTQTFKRKHTTRYKGEFIGPCMSVSEQGEKNGLISKSVGLQAYVVKPRQAGDPKNSDVLRKTPRPKLNVIDVNESTEAQSVDHDGVKITTQDGSFLFTSDMSQKFPKNFKDILKLYKPEAFETVNGVLRLKPEVRLAESRYDIKKYKLLVTKCASITLTNPDDFPIKDAEGNVVQPKDAKDGPAKTNREYLAKFRQELAALGIRPANGETYTEKDMENFDFSNEQNCVALHNALDAFLLTQARGNDKIDERDPAAPFPVNPRNLPAEGNQMSFNPALTTALYDSLQELLLSDEFKEGYHKYVLNPQHTEVSEAHLLRLLGEVNRKSRGNSGRSVMNFIAEKCIGLQTLGGFNKLFGKTTITTESLESDQCFTQSSTFVKEENGGLVVMAVTEGSKFEHPKGEDPVSRHIKTMRACSEHRDACVEVIRQRIQREAANDARKEITSPKHNPDAPVSKVGGFGAGGGLSPKPATPQPQKRKEQEIPTSPSPSRASGH